MYISSLKLWNFRKYGSPVFDLNSPHLTIPFNKGMNILIGENDSGKSAIIDAIKLVLKTHAYEWIKVEESDFYSNGNQISPILRIEIEFSGITNKYIEFLFYLILSKKDNSGRRSSTLPLSPQRKKAKSSQNGLNALKPSILKRLLGFKFWD